MARKKKIVTHYDEAVARLSALKSIDTQLDFGGGISVASYEAAVSDLRTKLDNYNTHLSLVDGLLNHVQEAETKLRDLSERVLTGVATLYGKNSDEYEKAGGRKKSERKRTPRKAV